MHCPKASTSGFMGEEKRSDLHEHPCMNSLIPTETDASVWRNLLTASKDAERLIACLFELHLITARSLVQIWDNLATAIELAQRMLKADHEREPSKGVVIKHKFQ